MLKRLLVIPLALALTAGHSPSRTDEVLDWNAIMTATVAAQNPFAQARFAAITQLAVFEAVNACTERYRPYLGTVNAPAGASAEAAAVSAAHGVLKHYVLGSAAPLDGARAQSLAAIAERGRESAHRGGRRVVAARDDACVPELPLGACVSQLRRA